MNGANEKTLNSDNLINEELSVCNDSFYVLPENYVNKYNLTRGDFAPLDAKAALARSLKEKGCVDVEYMASLTMLSMKDVILQCDGEIYRDPQKAGKYFYTGWVTADEYLSGNIAEKYRACRAAAEQAEENGEGSFRIYQKNMRLLKAVMPPKPAFGDISVSLGSPFLPSEYVAEFVQHLYRLSLLRNNRVCDVFYQACVHDWSVILNVDVKNSVVAARTFGTERMDMFKILEKTLNHEQIRITDADDGRSRKINREQTMFAEEKREKLIESFKRWLEELPEDKKSEITDVFYERFCCFLPRRFNAPALDLSDLNEQIELFDYQKRAAWRIMQSKSTLLAHDVGAGKTFAMVVAAHEMYKSGMSAKNLIVVPNSIVSQWENDYKLLYPSAKILTVSPQTFTPAQRGNVLNAIKDGEFEAVIMPYSSFEMIPPGYGAVIGDLKRKIECVEAAMVENARRRSKVKNRLNSLLQKAREKYCVRYNDALKAENALGRAVRFSDLGVTALFIDEAHNYKNLPLESSLGNIKGVNADGSDKCADVYLKTRTVINGGGKLIFATGTPVTNSVADVFVMQKYLTEDRLAQCDVDYFDNWAGTFGSISRSYEIDVDTENYRLTTRFCSFNNLGALSQMLGDFTDFHVVGADGLPEIGEIKTVVVLKTPLQARLLKQLSERVELIRAGRVDRKKDNLLKVTTDGRKLALDVRLLSDWRERAEALCDCPSAEEAEKPKKFGDKISVCAQNVYDFYLKYPGKTQLVFCDIGTPKSDFNVYDCLKDELVSLGMSAAEIGFVHDATGDVKRAKLFESVNCGEVKVLIGSTFKLGTGVNVQEKLIAVHHLDVPWRPSDMVQRDGRLIRRGNTNEKVYIFRYVTDGSFDAYSWQLLENKQRFITELLTGAAFGADERKLDDAVLSYAEVKALAVGNPLIKNRVEVQNELSRLKAIEREDLKRREELKIMLKTLPQQIADERQRFLDVKNDEAAYHNSTEIPDKQLIARLISKTITENALNAQEIFIAKIKNFKLILPANFNKVRPYLVLEGKTRYTVEIATFSTGAVTRIENFIASLDKIAQGVYENVARLEMQQKQAAAEIEKVNVYRDKIKELTAKLFEIDAELGLGKE